MFKSDNELLRVLLDEVESYDLQLPDFQRGWVWEDNRIKALLASLTLGYPIGAIMLLENGGEFHFKCKSVEGAGDTNVTPKNMILDGQQRLTSMFLSMRSKNPVLTRNDQNKEISRYYYLDIEKALNTTTDRIDAIISVDENRQIKANIGRDIVLDLSSKEAEYKKMMIPFNIMTNSSELNKWRNNFQEYHNFNPEIIKKYQTVDEEILQKIANYRIPIIQVLKEAPKEAVCQVFENVNQGGVPLTVFELLTATFAADNYDLKSEWEKIYDELSNYNLFENIDNTSFLVAITLLTSYRRGGVISCKRRDVLNLRYEDFRDNKDQLLEGFRKMNKLLIELCIFSNKDIPYGAQLIPLSVICAILDREFDNATVKDKLKKWFWCGVFGDLYGSSTDTRYAIDVPQVIAWCRNETNLMPRTINESSFNTMRLLSLQTKNSAAYKGIMALILNKKARDWITGTEMSVQNYLAENADIHHIFPRVYCLKQGYDRRKWNSIINKTPLFYATNRYIGGGAPSEYIKRIINNKNINEAEEFISTHMINYDYLATDDFDKFIIDRAKKLLDSIEDATGKPINDRDSDEVIKAFGVSLARNLY